MLRDYSEYTVKSENDLVDCLYNYIFPLKVRATISNLAEFKYYFLYYISKNDSSIVNKFII